MNNLLVAINAKYAHSSLAIRYLKKYHEGSFFEPKLLEFTINQHEDDILRELMTFEAEVITFSCYIWNYEMILRISKDLKTIKPDLKILLGGPEVSYGGREILEAHDFIDLVMTGEGEVTYGQVCDAVFNNKDLNNVKGITFRKESIITTSPQILINPLDEIPFPYDDLSELKHRKLYYESSRGCPFNCQYCLSSTTGNVRFFTLNRVKKDLLFFLERNVVQVKFVDRTFNADPRRALEILTFIHENDNGFTNFHFEIVASLLDESTMTFLEKVRPGLFQFEIGVQTTHDETMVAIDRNINFVTLSDRVKRLSSYKNIHLHLDLIAGLPFESFDIFLNSFEEVYQLKPEMLQLGFLKVLKGSGLRINKEKYGYVFSNYAPYEIFYNAYISYEELSVLKDVEEMVETYFNNFRFRNSLAMIITHHYNRAVDFYLDLGRYFREKGYFDQPLKASFMYEVLLAFYIEKFNEDREGFTAILKYDYYLNFKKPLPLFQDESDKNFKNICYDLLKEKRIFSEEDLSPKLWLKRLAFVKFDRNIYDMIKSGFKKTEKENMVVAFDYETKKENPIDYNVTRHFN